MNACRNSLSPNKDDKMSELIALGACVKLIHRVFILNKNLSIHIEKKTVISIIKME